MVSPSSSLPLLASLAMSSPYCSSNSGISGGVETLFDKIPVENGSVMGGSSPHPSGVSDGSYGNTNASCSYDL